MDIVTKNKVSIIIPCYNQSQYIIDALESVINQTYENFECIIVNDGSTDDTENITKEWIKFDSRFKYVYQNNCGLSNARNKGISLSKGKFILPLDSDDKISSNYIEDCFNMLNSSEDIKLVYGEAYFFDRVTKKWNLDKYDFEDLLYKNMIFCTALYRKSDWEKVGGYDENLKEGLEDWEFWINILSHGGRAVKINSCVFYYRQKETSMVRESVINNHYGYNSRLYIFDKHINLYKKTNFYDMYFENYRLKKQLSNPLSFLSTYDLLCLIIKSSFLTFYEIFMRVVKKTKRTIGFKLFTGFNF